MGLVIGKGGRRIQQISTTTGADVFTKRAVRNRVYIEAETEDAIERAKQEILRIVVSCSMDLEYFPAACFTTVYRERTSARMRLLRREHLRSTLKGWKTINCAYNE